MHDERMDADAITPHIARVVLYFFEGSTNPLGHPGSFGERHLITAASEVSEDYRDSLAKGFPGLVAAVRLIRRHGPGTLIGIIKDDSQARIVASSGQAVSV